MDEKISQTVIEPIGVKEKFSLCTIQFNSGEINKTGWRMADRLNAELYVLNVERENIDSISAGKSRRLKSGSC